MAGDVLILDTIVFEDFAIPDKIALGMGHILGVQKLIGGQRVIDAMGLDPEPIKWSGHFRGSDAATNSQALEALAASGNQVVATWGPYLFQVVVQRYSASYEAYFEVPYSIELVVLPADYGDTSGGQTPDNVVSSDMTTATTAGTFNSLPSLTPAGTGGIGRN